MEATSRHRATASGIEADDESFEFRLEPLWHMATAPPDLNCFKRYYRETSCTFDERMTQPLLPEKNRPDFGDLEFLRKALTLS